VAAVTTSALAVQVLGALQTLCWEAGTARAVVDAGAVEPLLELLCASDNEVRALAIAAAANLLAHSDTVFLTDEVCIDAFFDAAEVSAIRLRVLVEPC
jgi:Armadillo/beta-catenin-like repeat